MYRMTMVITFSALLLASNLSVQAQTRSGLNPFLPSSPDYLPGGIPGSISINYDIGNRLPFQEEILVGVHKPGDPCPWGFEQVLDRNGLLTWQCKSPPKPSVSKPPQTDSAHASDDNAHQATTGIQPCYYDKSGNCPDEIEELPPYIAGGEDVLLIHGFPGTAPGHDCVEYFSGQKEELADRLDTVVRTVGYYSDNDGCNDNVPGYSDNDVNTSITELAEELYRFVLEEYPPKDGMGVDIVAHSMGGLVVRKMLQDHGDKINVDQVVTLATPHGGANHWLTTAAVCFFTDHSNGIFGEPLQCTESSAGSEFMQVLQNNPQSHTNTYWTLLATDSDHVVGAGTGTDMSDGGGPTAVSRYTYRGSTRYVEPTEFGISLRLQVGHASMHGVTATKAFVEFQPSGFWGGSWGSIKNPTDRIVEALDQSE